MSRPCVCGHEASSHFGNYHGAGAACVECMGIETALPISWLHRYGDIIVPVLPTKEDE